jgi:hypothetical protein
MVGGTFGDYAECRYIHHDWRLNWPVATTYRITVNYTLDGANDDALQTVTATGSIASTLPPGPFITLVTITGEEVVRRPVEATYTAVGSGGVTPYQFRWKMSGTILRDWDDNPTFVWNGTINGQPVGAGSRTLEVFARSSGRTFVEASDTIPITVQ